MTRKTDVAIVREELPRKLAAASKMNEQEKQAAKEFFEAGIQKNWPQTALQRRMQSCGR